MIHTSIRLASWVNANQHSVSANVFFRSNLPVKNATVFLAKLYCYTGALSTTVVNQGGKAMVEDMYRRGGGNDEIIGYKELGSNIGGQYDK